MNVVDTVTTHVSILTATLTGKLKLHFRECVDCTVTTCVVKMMPVASLALNNFFIDHVALELSVTIDEPLMKIRVLCAEIVCCEAGLRSCN